MKRILITFSLFIFGMTIIVPAVRAQNMSYYTNEYMQPDRNFTQRLAVLEAIRSEGFTGIGEFYHDALRFLLLREPDIRDRTDQDAAEKCAVILCQGLGAERYTAAAHELWQTAVVFDVVRDATDGNAIQAALIALGEVNGIEYLPQVVLRLEGYNAQTVINAETRRRVQMAVIGCITALEAFHDVSGFTPVFFASIKGGYDPDIREIAKNALPNIVEDPGDVISAIIQDPSNNPSVKLTAWNEMLKTRAPNSSKARVAAVALATGWSYTTSNRSLQENLRDMRKSAINTIRQYGVADSSVYTNLDRSYSANFNSNMPDNDEIVAVLNTLAAVRTDEAVSLLHKYLQELHNRRIRNVWGNKERQTFQWVISCIRVTETRDPDIRRLLILIQSAGDYTPQEQRLAREAMNALPG